MVGLRKQQDAEFVSKQQQALAVSLEEHTAATTAAAGLNRVRTAAHSAAQSRQSLYG